MGKNLYHALQNYHALYKGTPPEKKNVIFRALPKLPLPPPTCTSFFGRQKGIYKVYFLIRARPSPPLIRAMPERKHFFSREVFPNDKYIIA